MAQALLRKLADVESDASLRALIRMLRGFGIFPTVHRHVPDFGPLFWRVYVRNSKISAARALVESLKRRSLDAQ